MKVKIHEKTPKPEVLDLSTNPMHIWLTRTVELTIEPGDRIENVAKVVGTYWKTMNEERIFATIAYWFSIGERVHKKGWKHQALKPTRGRRFQPPADARAVPPSRKSGPWSRPGQNLK